MKKIKNFKEMIEELNIYEPITINLLNEKDGKIYILNDNHNLIKSITNPVDDRVITRCIECDHEHSFYVHKTNKTYKNKNNKDFFIDEPYCGISESKNVLYLTLPVSNPEIKIINLYKLDYYIDYLLRCSHNYDHKQIVTLRIKFENNNVEIVKVGQDPLNTMLIASDSKIYSKQLKKFSIEDDFKNSVKSKDRNLYAGAVTYLRRIYEKIVDYYLNQINDRPENGHMKNKVEHIKNFLDEDFYNNSKNIYVLLSKGIHELDEDEILKMFDLLNSAILFQLDFEKQKDDRAENKKRISNELSHKASSFKK